MTGLLEAVVLYTIHKCANRRDWTSRTLVDLGICSRTLHCCNTLHGMGYFYI